jgi:hypothetical protein
MLEYLGLQLIHQPGPRITTSNKRWENLDMNEKLQNGTNNNDTK